MEDFKLNTIEEAIADFREGKFLIVVDDEDRENEGDLIMAAECCTPEAVNYMLHHGRNPPDRLFLKTDTDRLCLTQLVP